MKKSAIAEHAWTHHHPINWDENECDGTCQRTGRTIAKGGHPHPDDTSRRPIQQRWRGGASRMLDCSSSKTEGRGRPSHPSHVYP